MNKKVLILPDGVVTISLWGLGKNLNCPRQFLGFTLKVYDFTLGPHYLFNLDSYSFVGEIEQYIPVQPIRHFSGTLMRF